MENNTNPIISVMTLDIIRHLLEYSEDSEQLATQLTLKVRELTGAKIVALIQFPKENKGYSLLGISPMRRTDDITSEEMRQVFNKVSGTLNTTVWKSSDDIGEDYTYLKEHNYSVNLIAPLVSGRQQLGCLLVLGLVDERNLDFIVNVFDVMLGMASLVFKDASLISNQDEIIKRRTQELAKAKDKAEKASQIKSEFLANVSHEIRTPLNAIYGFTELLSSMATDRKQQCYLHAIEAASNNLMALINDILDLSKIEAGQLQIFHAPVNIRTIVSELKEIFQLAVKDKGLVFKVQIADSVPEYFIGDENRLRQVLLNLVGNAVKFTEEGWIKLSISHKHLNEKRDRATLEIGVKDSGIGIDQEDISSIFQPFKQVDSKNSRKHSGTGLGLSISNNLVEAMNGTISVSSAPGVGSLFNITFKDVEVCSESSHQNLKDTQERKQERQNKGKKILAVDDDAINRMLLEEILRKHEFDVIIAENGEQALLMLTDEQPDLIILDIQMPVMDGFEVVKKIRSDPRIKDIPVIALTAAMRSEIEKNTLLEKFTDCLSKPISQELLMTEIQRYIN